MKKILITLLLIAFGVTAKAQETGSILIQNATVVTIYFTAPLM